MPDRTWKPGFNIHLWPLITLLQLYADWFQFYNMRRPICCRKKLQENIFVFVLKLTSVPNNSHTQIKKRRRRISLTCCEQDKCKNRNVFFFRSLSIKQLPNARCSGPSGARYFRKKKTRTKNYTCTPRRKQPSIWLISYDRG